MKLEIKESESFRIEYWYYRHERSWVLQIFDNNDSEQECSTGISRSGLDEEIKYYCEKYNTTEVKKV